MLKEWKHNFLESFDVKNINKNNIILMSIMWHDDVYVSFAINLTIHQGCFNRPRSFKNLLKIVKKISSINHVMHNNTICKPIINLMYMSRRYHDPCLCMVVKCRSNTFGDFCKLCVSPSWKMWMILCPMSFAS